LGDGRVALTIDGRRATNSLEHFPAKHALGLDPGVDTGSPSENATTQREKSEARFYQNGIRSSRHRPRRRTIQHI
jgi:hypothetical protein